jgi:hypothetical protein
MLTEEEKAIIVNTRTLIAGYARHFDPARGEDIANDWVVSFLVRLDGGKSMEPELKRQMGIRASKFLQDIQPSINRGELPPCLKREAKRRVRRLLRKTAVSLEETGLMATTAQQNPELPGETPVENLVASLPSKRRKVVELSAEGISQKEIAKQLKVSPRTVRHWLSQVRRLAIRRGIRPSKRKCLKLLCLSLGV